MEISTKKKQFAVKEACERILHGDKEHYASSVPVDCIKTSIFVINTPALVRLRICKNFN